MSQLYIVPVGDGWISRYHATVENQIEIGDDGSVPEELNDLENVRLWGTTKSPTGQKRTHFFQMWSGDFLLFYHHGRFIGMGHAGWAFDSPEVGEWAWGEPASRWIFIVEDFEEVDVEREDLWRLLGYDKRYTPQGLVRPTSERVESLLDEYGSIKEAIKDICD